MVSPTSLAVYIAITSIGFLLLVRHYENDLARERRRTKRADEKAARAIAEVERLRDELDEATETLTELALASQQRHPANGRRVLTLVPSGGAS